MSGRVKPSTSAIAPVTANTNAARPDTDTVGFLHKQARLILLELQAAAASWPLPFTASSRTEAVICNRNRKDPSTQQVSKQNACAAVQVD